MTSEPVPSHSATFSYSPHVVLTGVSFRTLDVQGRELLVKKAEDPTKLAADVVGRGLASEAAVISTCNRFEIVTVGGEPGGGVRSFFENLLDLSHREALYQYVDSSAVKHLYRVSCSLDSMVLGEAQILGQVKDAYKRAVASGSVGSHLHHLFQSAFHVAKKVKAHTEISHHGVSVSYVAVRLAQQIFQDLSETRVMVVGSGEMAELATLHLCSHGCKRITVANRTVERAAELAERFGGAAVSLSDVATMLNDVDIVIGSIRTDHSLLTKGIVGKRRADTPLFLIDLGMPRNFAGDIAEIDNVYLYNIDDLAGIAQQNRGLREAAAKDAELVIDYGLLQFERWRRKLELQPELLNLRGRVDHICRTEMDRILRSDKECHLPQPLRDEISRAISQKLGHELSELVGRHLGDATTDTSPYPLLIVPDEGEM